MDMLYCYLAVFFLSGLLIFRLQHRRRRISPPSPFALPIIGHLHLIKDPLHKALETLSLRYGPILFLRFGVRPVVVISSPSAVEECFTRNDIIFANRPPTLFVDVLSYNYTSFVLAPYGHLWRCLRRLAVNEIFSTNALQKFSAIREEEVYCNLLRRLYEVSKGGNQKVELRFFFSLLTFSVSMRMISGKRCVEGEATGMEVGRQHIRELKEIFIPSASMNICDFLPILRWIGYKGLEKNMVKLHRRRDEFLQSLIDEVRQNKNVSSSLHATRETEKGKNMTMIETLLSLQEFDPDSYSDSVIKSIILIMFVAGTDTVGVTLEWAMSLLLNHPEVLEKVRAEIDSHVEDGRLIDDSDISKLPYLQCVVKETLRLYPAAPLLLPHFSSSDCTLEGYKIPRKTILLVNAWALHRDPKVWDEPTKFKPVRFEAVEGKKEGFKFVAFGVGRRACPGTGMGMRMVSLALGALIQCFEWEKVGQEVDMNCGAGPSLSKAVPLEAVCTPRKTKNLVELVPQL
ncbi:cytochrome P450 81C13-like [Malania oleifera]|uniref:cytochrome P450 81C13-like n=1 Tax=Malania oleifera TaxID=397392 RepID=UPI0025ADAD6B|nr:cytochrome P450 81C13-like [Malania oleifera]